MGVFIAHAEGVDGEHLRQIVLNAGADCAAGDSVPLAELPVRLPQVMADAIVIVLGEDAQQGVATVEHAVRLSSSPILAFGPIGDPQLEESVRKAGARDYLDAADIQSQLDHALDALSDSEEDARLRGTIVSVYSPTAGSGSTTVASNLAASFGRYNAGDVALAEFSRRDGDLAMLFDIEPAYTVEYACERWDRLDSLSLGSGLVEHDTGVLLLAHGADPVRSDKLTPEAIRRISVLLRSMFAYTVLDLDSNLSHEQAEAMRLSDVLVVVLRADVPAIRRAQRILMDIFDQGVEQDRVRLVVNRWGQSGQLPLRSIAELLEMEPFQTIPEDTRRVNASINQGLPLIQLSKGAPITRRFVQLASQLNGKAT